MTVVSALLLTSIAYIFSFMIVIRYFNHIFLTIRVKKITFYMAALGLLLITIADVITRSVKSGNVSINIMQAVTIACIMSLLYQGKIRLKLLYSILAVVFSAFSSVVVLYIVMLLSGQSIPEFANTHKAWSLMVCIVSIFVFFVILSLISKLLSDVKSLVPIKFIILLITIPLISMVGMLIMFQELSQTIKTVDYLKVIVRFAILLCILYANCIVFYLFDNVVKYMRKTADEQLLKKQIQLQDRFYKRLESSQTEIREIRHNMKHRLEAIRIQLDEEEYSRAKADLSSMLTNIEMQRIVDSGNPQLDAILNLKLSEAQEAGIKVETKVFVASGLHLTFSDMCVLIGNAFDNAIEACQKIGEGEKRITLEMSSVNQALFLSISNSLANAAVNDLQSSKEDMKNHGFGLTSIRYMAEKYNGTVNIQTTGQTFNLEVVLQNPN